MLFEDFFHQTILLQSDISDALDVSPFQKISIWKDGN